MDACFDIKGLLFTGKDATECEWLLETKSNIPNDEFERLNRLRWLISRGNRTVSLFLDEMLFTVERAGEYGFGLVIRHSMGSLSLPLRSGSALYDDC